MNEYRCTRNAPYSHDCFGKDDLGARQGYYIEAETEEQARLEMVTMFPDQRDAAWGFTAEVWKTNVNR